MENPLDRFLLYKETWLSDWLWCALWCFRWGVMMTLP